MAQPLYEKYGGFSAIGKIVLDFYGRALDSEVIGHHFEDVDMARLMDHQTKFVSTLLGGPVSFTDERLRQVHGPLAISAREFEAMTALFKETLKDHGFSATDAASVAAEFERRRGLILG